MTSFELCAQAEALFDERRRFAVARRSTQLTSFGAAKNANSTIGTPTGFCLELVLSSYRHSSHQAADVLGWSQRIARSCRSELCLIRTQSRALPCEAMVPHNDPQRKTRQVRMMQRAQWDHCCRCVQKRGLVEHTNASIALEEYCWIPQGPLSQAGPTTTDP